MKLPLIYDASTTAKLFERINLLTAEHMPLWGKMNVNQMLAHCSVAFEQLFGENNIRAPFMMRALLKLFFKNSMVNDTPYKKNLPTAPAFIIANERDFNLEKGRLISYLQKLALMQSSDFEYRIHLSLGTLSAVEWSNLLYKHLDHHLNQFGV